MSMPLATSRSRYCNRDTRVPPALLAVTFSLLSGFFQRHQSAEKPLPGIHQRLRGGDAHGVRAEPEDPLHRALAHHKTTEGGQWPSDVSVHESLLPSAWILNVWSDYKEADWEETEPDQEGLPRPHLLQRGCATDPSGEHSRHTWVLKMLGYIFKDV